MKPKEIAENLELAQTILGQWIRYRQYYRKGISAEDVGPQDEAEFLETTSSIAQNVRRLGQKVDEKAFPFRKNEMSALLKSTVSVQSFRAMADADRKKFYKEWHQALVLLTRMVGALKFQSEGYRPPVKKARGKKKPASKMVPVVITVVVLVALGMAVKFLGLL